MMQLSEAILTKNLVDLSSIERSKIADAGKDDTEIGLAVASKVVRLVSIKRFGLKEYVNKKCLENPTAFYDWAAAIITSALQNGQLSMPDRLKSINGLLWVSEGSGRDYNSTQWLNEIKGRACANAPKDAAENGDVSHKVQPQMALKNALTDHTFETEQELKSRPSLVIFAPTNMSAYSNAVVFACLELGFQIDRIIVRKISISRVFGELRSVGFKNFVKKIQTKVFRREEAVESPPFSLNQAAHQLGVKEFSLKKIAKKHCIPISFVDHFRKVDAKSNLRPNSMCLFTGGGLVDAQTIGKFDRGVINVHSGHLPEYKGMGVLEAAVLDGNFDKIGLTSHLIDAGIDTGPLIEVLRLDLTKLKNLHEATAALDAFLPLAMVSAVLKISQNRVPTNQDDRGTQFYPFHQELANIANECIENSVTDTNIIEQLYHAMLENTLLSMRQIGSTSKPGL